MGVCVCVCLAVCDWQFVRQSVRMCEFLCAEHVWVCACACDGEQVVKAECRGPQVQAGHIQLLTSFIEAVRLLHIHAIVS
jgi:hypothetical protein